MSTDELNKLLSELVESLDENLNRLIESVGDIDAKLMKMHESIDNHMPASKSPSDAILTRSRGISREPFAH